MNADSAEPVASRENPGRDLWLAALAALLVGLIAVTSRSLWIDEACTAGKAIQSTFAGWWQVMFAEKGGDLQMPLYMLYVWGFAKLFGTGEWALRAANIPWFVAGVTAFITIFPRGQRLAAALVVLISPFAWYYLNEARPYIMQLGASLILLAAVCRFCRPGDSMAVPERIWAIAFCVGIVSLSGSSLFGMLWACAACLSLPFLVSWKRLVELVCAHLVLFLVATVVELAIGLYYLWSLNVGARGSAAGETGFRNLTFIAYELLGFGGLGPGRNELRDGGLAALAPFVVPLTLYGAAVLGVLPPGITQLARRATPKARLGVAVVLALPLVIMLAAGHAIHFRVLARHCAPLLVIFLAAMTAGLDASRTKRIWTLKFAAAGFLLLTLFSCLSIRFGARHEKDDYRSAAALAKAALGDGRSVWWNASREGAVYYQVPTAPAPPASKQALLLMNPAPELLGRLPPPDLVIQSKPDVFDSLDAVGQYVRRGSYTPASGCRAFSVWQPGK